MATPVGTLCTSIVNKTQNANHGVVLNKHAVRFTAVFPAGSAIAYIPVGQLSADDLVVVSQRGVQAGLQIQDSRSLRVPDSQSGYVELMTEDNANASTNVPVDINILRYT